MNTKLKEILYKDLQLAPFMWELQTLKIKKIYPSLFKRKKPIIIYMCNELGAMGGLSDRIHSMISTYKYCKKEGYEFKLAHFCPFDIGDFLLPNKVDWRISKDMIDMDLHNVMVFKTTETPYNIMKMSWRAGEKYQMDYLNKKMRHIRKSVKQVHLYIYARWIDEREFSELFHEMFKPTEELQKLIDWNKKQLGGPFISVTARFQNLMGDFYEGKQFGTLKKEKEKAEYIRKCVDKVAEIHGKHPNMKILVTADSARFLTAVKELPYVHVIPGELVHMLFTTNSTHANYLKNFVDLMTLSEAQKLYLIMTGKMYRSGFAETASFINLREYEDVRF